MKISIGIDIGGTRIKAVAIDENGHLLKRAEAPTANDRDGLVHAVRDLTQQLGEADACGIAAPGIAALDGRCITWMQGRLDSVQGLVWSEVLERPVTVLNDAQAATLAEAWIGAAEGKRHVVMLTLGTGVGGGVICDGRPLAGATGRAGHLGHICLDMHGSRDLIGTPGSLEDKIGECTLANRSGGRFTSTERLLQAVAAGDENASTIWAQSIRALACGLVSLINIFDPEAIVLGGGIANSGSMLLTPLRETMQDIEWRPKGRPVPILLARLGAIAGAIGAARWAAAKHDGLAQSTSDQ